MLIAILTLFVLLQSCTEPSNPPHNLNTSNAVPEDDTCAARVIPNEFLVKWQDGRISVEQGESTESFIDTFINPKVRDIAWVEHNREFKFTVPVQTFSEVSENPEYDEFYPEVNWGHAVVNAQYAYDRGYFGQDVVVAVIDSGVDVNHPQLSQNIYVNPGEVIDGKDNDKNGLIDDINGWDFFDETGDMSDPNGHGTHVAGIIAADHGIGNVMGMAPQVKVIALKFMGKNGEGDLLGAIKSIQYAKKQGARVINASWGGRKACSELLEQEIASLEESNTLFVAAAGNSTVDLDEDKRFREYPAAFKLIPQLVVGASTHNDRMVNFSNYGKDLVNLLAPGYHIVSTYPSRLLLDADYLLGGEVGLDGTSMAAPFVSGAAALLWSAKPDAKFDEVKSALMTGVSFSPDKDYPYPVSSQGRLNVRKALETLLGESVE